jgi:hypothetical protein
MLGTRLPVKLIKTVDRIADALSTNRSRAIRWLVEQAVEQSGSVIMLLRQGRASRMADRIVQAHAADIRADAARVAANRQPKNADAATRALRARRAAIDQHRAVTDPQYRRMTRPVKGLPRILSEADLKNLRDWTDAQLAALRRSQ